MLSTRERHIAIVTVVVLAVLAADWYVLTPLLAERDALATQRESMERELESNDRLFKTQQTLNVKWNQILGGGLRSSASEAEGQLLNALRQWSHDAGVTLGSVKPERQSKLEDMQELSFQAIGSGSMKAIATFLHRLESTAMPIRIRELQLTSRTEGTDDLTVQLRLSTVYRAEAKPASASAQAVTARTSEGP